MEILWWMSCAFPPRLFGGNEQNQHFVDSQQLVTFKQSQSQSQLRRLGPTGVLRMRQLRGDAKPLRLEANNRTEHGRFV